MFILFQNVINNFACVKSQITKYVQGLILLEGRKNCATMARKMGISKKRLYKSFDNSEIKTKTIRKNLKKVANKTQLYREKRVLIIDITCMAKRFARKIDELAVDYSGVLKESVPGLFITVCALSVGGNVFPLDFRFWKNEFDKIGWDIKHNENFKSKIDLAIELIKLYKNQICFDYLALDGAYCTVKMLNFINNEKIDYTIRIGRDRVVKIGDDILPLKFQPKLKLIRNERCKSVKGFYKEHACVFTVHKQKQKNGKWVTVFIISNMHLSAKDHVVAYSRRWPIEKSFRSMKQHMGLNDCQMCKGAKQALHIFNVFLAYSMATVEKIANKKNSIEEVLKIWRKSKLVQKFSRNNYSAEA